MRKIKQERISKRYLIFKSKIILIGLTYNREKKWIIGEKREKDGWTEVGNREEIIFRNEGIEICKRNCLTKLKMQTILE